MAYLTSSESSGTTSSSELEFLLTSSDEDLSVELRKRNQNGKYPKKKWLKPEQQSQLLVRKDPVGLFPDHEKSTLAFKRERKLNRHHELDRDPNRGSVVSIHGKDPVNPTFENKWARTTRELQIPVIGDKRRGYAVRRKGKELRWRPDKELMGPPVEEPTSHSIYEDGYQNPTVHIPLRIEQFADASLRNTYVPIIAPRIHALEGGIVHVFDSRSLRTYRIFDKQEFDLIASLRFDEMLPEEQLTCLSFVRTRHSIGLGFADGNAAICRVEMDNSTQIGRGRHNFEYVMAPAKANLVITKIEQHPCTPRFVALSYYDTASMSYIVRVIDQDRLLDKDNNILTAGDKEKEFFSQYPDDEDQFGGCQGPFRTVDGKLSIPMKEPRQHVRILSIRIVERITDIMWFSDRRYLLMVFTEKTMRLLDISREEKKKVLKSATLAHPLTSPSTHPSLPSLFSALDRHRVLLFDRRCLKAPVSIVDVPAEALGRGTPSLAVWCPSDMNKLFIHFRASQRAAVIQFNTYPDCSKLTDGACKESEVDPVQRRLPKSTEEVGVEEFRWPYNINDEYPMTVVDHFIAEDDVDGGLMEAIPFPAEWKCAQCPLVLKPEYEVHTISFSSTSIRRVQSDPDLTSINEDGIFVHPFKRYATIARERRDSKEFLECVEWTVWDQMNSLTKKRSRRSRSEERSACPTPRKYLYGEEEDIIRPFPITKTFPYLPHFEKNEVVYPVYTSDFVDVITLETTLKMSRPLPKNVEFFHHRSPPQIPVRQEKIDYENFNTTQPPGPVMPIIKREKRFDVPLNHTRIPLSHGGMYYGIQGRPLKQMRSTIDHAKFYDTHDETRYSEMTNSKKKRLIKEKRCDEIMRILMDEEEDLMSSNDCRWIRHHESATGGCDPEDLKFDEFVQRLRKSRIHDSDDSDNASSIDLHDDSFRRANDIRDITKNDLCFVADRSIFDVTSKQKSITKAAYNTHLLELPVEDPQSLCLLAFSMEMIVQGAPSDVTLAPNSIIMKIAIDEQEPPKKQQRFGFPQVANMSAYLRSVLGMNALQSVKLGKLSGFGEFEGEDIPKGYMDTLKHLREHLEDSDANRFALDYIERLFNDNHLTNHDRGFPRRFEVPNPIYSDTTDEDDPKAKKKKIVFASHDDRPKMEQLKEKLYKKRRSKFLKRRRACEELKLEYETVFPQEEVKNQKCLLELYNKGDPKRSIIEDPVPRNVYELYSGSSDSNEEAHYLPQVTVRQPIRKIYDFEEEEQIIAKETREIQIIQKFRKQGKIPPFEFQYDQDGNMFYPKSATLKQEYNQNIQTTRTLLRRMVERDARIHELVRRREIMLDRLPEEVAEDTYDQMMSDLKVLFDELEDNECNLAMTGNYFRTRRLQRRRVYGRGWRENRKLQHKFLNQSLDLCDKICHVRQLYQEHSDDEKRRRRELRKAQKQAKMLLRAIARRDISGDYMRVIQEVQFRRHSRVRDFDLYDFLEAFEEVTLKICGRRFSSHQGIIRTMTHLRKDRFERMDPRYNDDVRPCFTDESDSDFEELQVSSVSADSSSSLSGQTLADLHRPRKLVKRRKKNIIAYSESEDNSDGTVLKLQNSPSEAEPAASCEMLEEHPDILLPNHNKIFFEDYAATLPITTLVHNPVDPLKQLASYSKKDIKPPPRLKIGRPKRIKNRKQRNKRDNMRRQAEQAELKEQRKEKEKIAMNEIVKLMSNICISSPIERETEWKRRREARMKEAIKHSAASPGRLIPYRSITRKLLDKLRIGGGPRPIRVYANGSIYPPPKIPFSRIFDKFNPYTNPFARKPAADPQRPRPRPTFLDDSSIEIAVAVDLANDKSIFPPDEFGYPLRIGERIPNNVMWMFPKYWAMRLSRRNKQNRKRKRRWLGRVQDDISQYFSRDIKRYDYGYNDDDYSNSTCSTIIDNSLLEIPELTVDELYMAKFICISNPGVQRSLSAIDLFRRDDFDLLLRPRSCIGRITDDLEPLDDVEAEFAGSQELPPPPGLTMDEDGQYVWYHDYSSFEQPRRLPTKVNEDFSDTRPLSFLLSPLHFSDDDNENEDDDITPVPPSDDQKTPTEFSINFQLHTNTPEAENIRIQPMDSEESSSKMAENESALDKRKAKLVEEHEETDEHVRERIDYLMEKLFFEELGVVPEQLKGGVSPNMTELSESFPAAWLSLNKPRKFKRTIIAHTLPTIPEGEMYEDSDNIYGTYKQMQLKTMPSIQRSDYVLSHYQPEENDEELIEERQRIRPGTPMIDIYDYDSDDESEEDMQLSENWENCESMDDLDATDIDDDLEDEQYKDDQDDMEIMECFKSESDEDPLGDSPRIDSAQEEREESIELTAIDAAATVPEAPIVTTEMINSLPVEVMFEGASMADDVSSDEAADEEVMNVFGRNLVPPPHFANKAIDIDPKALPPPPIEETPVSIELSDNEAEDEITVAEEAFDSLLDSQPSIPITVTIPDAIPRPERLLDLMPSNLIFEGVDYWGLTEAQMEDALDELISERERIREELMRPPPKKRQKYVLVHEVETGGKLKEVVELEFSSSDSESYEGDSCSKSISPDKIQLESLPTTQQSHIIYTAGKLEVSPPTPPPEKDEIYIPARDKKRIQNKIRWWREKIIDKVVEDEAWNTLLDYIKCEFHHNSYGRKPVVYVPHLNLVRGIPRHILKTYIDQMRVRRWEENDLMEMLEEQNHLFRLKASAGVLNKNPSRTMQMGHMKNESGRNLTISFSNPVSVIPTRIYQPIRSAPKKKSILKIRPLTPELPVTQPVEPALEVPVERVPTTEFVFKKTMKKIELPHPDDTKFPTEQGYTVQEAVKFRFGAHKNLLRPGTERHQTRFIYKCRGIPGIIHIAMKEQRVKKEYIKDTALLGGFYFMRSKERISVLRAVGLCDYKSDQIAELLETRRMKHENPIALALMSLIMGQGTYTINFLTRVQRDGWYGHRLEDRRARNEADAIIRYFLLYCEWRTESQRLSYCERNSLRRGLLDKYLAYKQLEDACIFTRCMMAFLLNLAYSETRHFVDDVVLCKQVPMMFRVAFATLFCETTAEWQQTLLELLKELSPHDIQRFAFTGVGRHPDSMNAILEFAKHTSDVQFASFLFIIGECFDVQPFVKCPRYYEKRAIDQHNPRREVYKYWFALNNEMDSSVDRERRLNVYGELIKCQSALLGYTLKHDLYQVMKEKARPPMEQSFPVALLYPQTDMKILDQMAYEVMRHYAYVLQITHNWIAAAQVMYVMKQSETLGIKARFETEVDLACSFCCTTLSYGRKKARLIKKEEKKKLEDARERHMEAQRRRMEQGLAPQPFTGGPKKGPIKDIPDDVDTKIRAIACLACKKPLPRCAICFNHMFNPIANEDGLRGEQVGFGFAACRRCHHGGHPDHLDIWFRENYRCPVSQCNCECDYDNFWDTLTLHESLDYKLLGAPQLTLGIHQGPDPVPPSSVNSDEDSEAIEEEDSIDEEEKELDDAKKRIGYGRISID
ncbi:hypothetical protein PRIPAC_97218 [Pristionchus pacificus]|uniref:GATOR2 complex protein MIO zinc-ribbon like domain-containing protein n=1 Tax=Pristionchus pacificus TaxID=54126 RepID=A0A8R1V3B5_PRIPA|nr:hypothetical protein PRIPAC_97218 [Pristionchus pacificus]